MVQQAGSRWYVCADTRRAAQAVGYLRAAVAGAEPRVDSDGVRLRERLLSEPADSSSVIVGEGASGPDAVNLAAALAADGRAREVVLAVETASGSLRSRAARAGVARVLTSDEMASAVRAAHASGDSEGASSASAAPARTAGERGNGGNGAPVLCLVSGRGGVGKSAVAAVGAHVAASWGMDVALLDLDLAFGSLRSLCGIDRAADLAQLSEGEALTAETVARLGRSATKGVSVWGPCERPEYAEVVQPRAGEFVEALAASHDLVIVDTTTNWGDAVAQAVQAADRLLIVADERPGAVEALARCGELAVRLGVARTRIVRLMNACDARRRDEGFLVRAGIGLECARELRVLDGGAEAEDLLAEGHAAELARLENPLVTSLATGLAQLLRELGRLPECENARKAAERTVRPRRRLLALGREAS